VLAHYGEVDLALMSDPWQCLLDALADDFARDALGRAQSAQLCLLSKHFVKPEQVAPVSRRQPPVLGRAKVNEVNCRVELPTEIRRTRVDAAGDF
jgi:hypothetical protein